MAATALAELYATVRLFVNFFQPSFKLAEKHRDGARVHKRYHKPATPYQRLLTDPRTADDVRETVKSVYATLDPVRLLRDMRAGQQRLIEIADAPGGPAEAGDVPALDMFLTGLRTAWQNGEVRPTARSKPKAKRGWRRPDPLLAVTPKLESLVQGGTMANGKRAPCAAPGRAGQCISEPVASHAAASDETMARQASPRNDLWVRSASPE